MKRGRLVLLVIVLLVLAGTTALAQTSGYSLDWWTVDGGGVSQSTGGGYTLSGTIGQADAGTLRSSDGSMTLDGGYWAAPSRPIAVHIPLVEH